MIDIFTIISHEARETSEDPVHLAGAAGNSIRVAGSRAMATSTLNRLLAGAAPKSPPGASSMKPTIVAVYTYI